jgi:hypothetical protein
MLRLVLTSILEALGIVLCAVLFVFAAAYFIERDTFGVTPLLLLLVYPLPVWIATARKHNDTLDIMVVNMWLGWTVICWVAVLMRACYGETSRSSDDLLVTPEAALFVAPLDITRTSRPGAYLPDGAPAASSSLR